jgi:hypothetical protein
LKKTSITEIRVNGVVYTDLKFALTNFCKLDGAELTLVCRCKDRPKTITINDKLDCYGTFEGLMSK